MCLLIVEVLLLVAGLWTILFGEFPSGLFRVLFGNGHYHAKTASARLFGLLLITPILLSFLIGFLFSIFLGADAALYASLAEFFILITVCLVAVVIARKIKVPDAT